MRNKAKLYQYVPIGSTDPSMNIETLTIAPKILEGGWEWVWENKVKPLIALCEIKEIKPAVCLWCPLGHRRTQYLPFGQITQALNTGNREIIRLAETFRSFLTYLAFEKVETMVYYGSLVNDPLALTLRGIYLEYDQYLQENVALCKNRAKLAIDGMSKADPSYEADLRKIGVIAGSAPIVEGWVKTSNRWLGDPRLGHAYEQRFAPSDPQNYIPLDQIEGDRYAWLVHAPSGADKQSWVRSQVEQVTPQGIHCVLEMFSFFEGLNE